MWWIIAQSAMACNCAFMFQLCGFLIIVGLGMLPYIWQQLLVRKVSVATWFNAGFVWGAIALGGPLCWIVHFLFHHASLSLITIMMVYVFFVCCVALTTACWWMVGGLCAQKIGSLGAAVLSGSIYFSMCCYWYPLANPCIPLVQYRWCARLITMVGMVFYGTPEYQYNHNSFIVQHCLPPINRCSLMHVREQSNPYVIAGQVSKALAHAISFNPQLPHIICAPESTFFYALNSYEHLYVQWQQFIKSNDVFLIGALYEQDNKQYQAVFCLTEQQKTASEKKYFVTLRPIIQIYVKQQRLKLFEYLPSHIKKNNYLAPFFLYFLNKIATGKHFSNPQKLMKKIDTIKNQSTCLVQEFMLPNQLTIIPKICSEFFLTTSMQELINIRNRNATILTVFVNDSWFCTSFRQAMQSYAQLCSLYTQCPMIYVGHFGNEIFLY